VSQTKQIEITPDMTMQQILQHAPSAQRALFQRYHVGGCSSCAYQPTDTLAEVCRNHNLLDVPGVVQHLRNSHEVDQRMQVGPDEVQSWLASGEELRFIDMRSGPEAAASPVAGAEPLDFANQGKYMELPKGTRIVFLDQSGTAALDAAAYFAGHGFERVYAVRGGAEAWRARQAG
jgi:rhodanese-related sulfurtransferase